MDDDRRQAAHLALTVPARGALGRPGDCGEREGLTRNTVRLLSSRLWEGEEFVSIRFSTSPPPAPTSSEFWSRLAALCCGFRNRQKHAACQSQTSFPLFNFCHFQSAPHVSVTVPFNPSYPPEPPTPACSYVKEHILDQHTSVHNTDRWIKLGFGLLNSTSSTSHDQKSASPVDNEYRHVFRSIRTTMPCWRVLNQRGYGWKALDDR
ncbi:hypothetical protein B0T13DRAFT_166633 [Neurospora crassa]|nr:hypothetical protein B0T13DRAFT_166633 [Neurospora crassa]